MISSLFFRINVNNLFGLQNQGLVMVPEKTHFVFNLT